MSELKVKIPAGWKTLQSPSEELKKLGQVRFFVTTPAGTKRHVEVTLHDVMDFLPTLGPIFKGDVSPKGDTDKVSLSWPKAIVLNMALASAIDLTNNLLGGPHILDLMPPKQEKDQDRKRD